MPQIDPEQIIAKYIPVDSPTYPILIEHGRQVSAKALEIADLNPDEKIDRIFLHQAAMLHDIGISQVNSPNIGCFGNLPYVCHGIEGKKILEQENLPQHALICERHVGLGLDREIIANQSLPLPNRDMTPQMIEEKIICLADKFFSKGKADERTFQQVVANQIKHNIGSVSKLVALCLALNYPITFKQLNFSDKLPDMILSGKKFTTWRINDDKNLQTGDLLSMTKNQREEFARAVIYQTGETTFGELNDDDLSGHETFTSPAEMYQTYSKYYHMQVGEDTPVKVIKFKLL